MKHIFKKIYELLNEEPVYKHPKIKFIPNVVLNSIGYLIYILILFKIFSYIFK
jgi:hypothetical protein